MCVKRRRKTQIEDLGPVMNASNIRASKDRPANWYNDPTNPLVVLEIKKSKIGKGEGLFSKYPAEWGALMTVYTGSPLTHAQMEEEVRNGNDKIYELNGRYINGNIPTNVAGKIQTECWCRATCFVDTSDGTIKILSNGANKHSRDWEMSIDYGMRYISKEHDGTMWEFLKNVNFCHSPFDKRGQLNKSGKGH